MKRMLVVFAVIAWLASAVAATGYHNAWALRHLPHTYNYREQIGTSLAFDLLGGPYALFFEFMFSGFGQDGWTLKSQHVVNEGKQ